jgi:hypothetical protein
MLNNRLPSKESLVRREISIADLTHCTGAYGKEESVNHLFFECDFFWGSFV